MTSHVVSRADKSTGVRPFAGVFEGLVAKVAAATPAEKVSALHRAFEERTGAFSSDDPWFEVRSRAFWDDVMTRQGGAALLPEPLSDDERTVQAGLARSHRGLFRSHPSGVGVVLSDVLSGAEFDVTEVDEAGSDALASTTGLFDGTVVALSAPARLALLPGAIFHAEEADDAIAAVIAIAHKREIPKGALLDALLRMELSLRTLSRVKPSYAYRAEAL